MGLRRLWLVTLFATATAVLGWVTLGIFAGVVVWLVTFFGWYGILVIRRQ